MKTLFFLVMLLCMTLPNYAQCPDTPPDDAREVYSIAYLIPGGMAFTLCTRHHSLHNEVICQMNPDFNLGPNQWLSLDFGSSP